MAAKLSPPSSKFSLSGVSASPILLDLAALFYLKINDFSIVFQFSVCFRYECWLSLANPSHLKKSSFHLKRFHCFFLYFIYLFLAVPCSMGSLLPIKPRLTTQSNLPWKHRFLTTGLPGKSPFLYFKTKKKKEKFLNWDIIDQQHCVNLRCTMLYLLGLIHLYTMYLYCIHIHTHTYICLLYTFIYIL